MAPLNNKVLMVFYNLKGKMAVSDLFSVTVANKILLTDKWVDIDFDLSNDSESGIGDWVFDIDLSWVVVVVEVAVVMAAAVVFAAVKSVQLVAD
ncbi:hypothetical protein G9A89_000678 [Geosiphon pyriformis]|nr:hypothetical protein G9A89_000678 [Geosiphon pyriformis]